jgi:hypothetical protein
MSEFNQPSERPNYNTKSIIEILEEKSYIKEKLIRSNKIAGKIKKEQKYQLLQKGYERQVQKIELYLLTIIFKL